MRNFAYKYKFGRCDSTYIGEMIRQVTTHLAQHRKVPVYTGLKLKPPGYNRIGEHCSDIRHKFCNDNFAVLRVDFFSESIQKLVKVYVYISTNSIQYSIVRVRLPP